MVDSIGLTDNSIISIYEAIKCRIICRELLPDVKINQNQIAKDLNVSRTPVIKALHMLKSEGLVDNIPNRGFYVHKASLQETVELYELRQAVEMVAAANTAEYASMDEIRHLRDIFAPFANRTKIDADLYAEADREFHSRLIELSQNGILQRTNQSILILPKAFTSGLLRSPHETLQEHFNIVDALMNRDSQHAQQMAWQHFTLTLKMLRGAMESLRKIGMDPRKISAADISLDQHKDAASLSQASSYW